MTTTLPADLHDEAFFRQMWECRDNYRLLGECIHLIVGRQDTCLDIGCGIGLQTKRLMELGWTKVQGAEYSPVAERMREPGVDIIPFDLTKVVRHPQKRACVVCTETAEHIPEEHADTIVTVVTQHARDVIVWSAAAPGQEWHGHLNLQKPEYWLKRFAERGWVPDVPRTGALRDLMRESHAQHWMGSENFFVLVPADKYKPIQFTVTSTALNAERYIERSIESVSRQTYGVYQHIIVDAASDDLTARFALRLEKKNPRLTVHVNAHRKAALENVWDIWMGLPKDEVIVWLDGDDWLATDHAFDILARVYAHPSEPWVTYGQFMMATGDVGFAGPYAPGENARRTHWRATHLKTFRAGLVQRLKKEDVLKPDGSWCDLAIDKAVMYPLLELSGHHQMFIPQILYVYNAKASWWACQPEHEREKELSEVYRMQMLPPKKPLTERPW